LSHKKKFLSDSVSYAGLYLYHDLGSKKKRMNRTSLVTFSMPVPTVLCVAVGCKTATGHLTGEVIDAAIITCGVKLRMLQYSSSWRFAISVENFQYEIAQRVSGDKQGLQKGPNQREKSAEFYQTEQIKTSGKSYRFQEDLH
jgi:hypothetical protein